MRTILLMRHAKSSWGDPTQDDHERPLNKRGTKDAPRMAARIEEEGLVPQLVLCSDAVRTRATLALMLAEWSEPKPRVVYDPGLYLAEPPAIMEAVYRVGPEIERLMLLGHNPGMHALALGLTGDGDRRSLAELAMHFPTSALAVIELEPAAWKDAHAGSGRLTHYLHPKNL